MKLKQMLDRAGISQRDLAKGIGRSDAYVSMLISGDVGASQETIDAVLSYLSARLHKRVTYEMAFGSPAERVAAAESK